MRNLLALSFTLCLGLAWLLPSTTHAQYVDLSISASSIRFSKDTLYAGETVRIYATIRNQGDTDSVAQVFFYKSDTLIGKSQPISVVANGGGDDVFVDYKLPEGSFNIRAVIQGAEPADNNLSNNEAITPLFRTISDDDRDGVLNENDNCVDDENVDQADLDQDGRGDVCDADIDNDGVTNGEDDYPRDASKSKKQVTPPPVVEQPKPEPVKTEPPQPQPESVVAVVEPVVAVAETPEPVVEGVTDDPELTLAEPQEVALDLSGLTSGAPVSSPAARFTFRQLDWRTYEFVAIPPLGGGDYTYAWDFGDGASSVQSNITHAFPSSGIYTVTLATVNADGEVTTDAQELSVSFFHLANPLLLITLAVLLFIIGGLVILIIRLRRGEEV